MDVIVFLVTSIWAWGILGQAKLEGISRLIMSVFGGLLLMYLFFYVLARIEMSLNQIPLLAYMVILVVILGSGLAVVGFSVYHRINRPPPPFHP